MTCLNSGVLFVAGQALNMLLPLNDLCWRPPDQTALADYEYACISCFLLPYENSFYMRIHSTPDIGHTYEELRDLNVVLKEIEPRCDEENSKLLEFQIFE